MLLAAAALVLLNVLGGPAYERLAVLPPANLMNDPEQEYFVQGVHTALISELQRAGVAVIARTSVMRYENTQMLVREIAQELGVDALLEPSGMRAGDSVEIGWRPCVTSPVGTAVARPSWLTTPASAGLPGSCSRMWMQPHDQATPTAGGPLMSDRHRP